MNKIKTGIELLDKELDGGFPLNGLVQLKNALVYRSFLSEFFINLISSSKKVLYIKNNPFESKVENYFLSKKLNINLQDLEQNTLSSKDRAKIIENQFNLNKIILFKNLGKSLITDLALKTHEQLNLNVIVLDQIDAISLNQLEENLKQKTLFNLYNFCLKNNILLIMIPSNIVPFMKQMEMDRISSSIISFEYVNFIPNQQDLILKIVKSESKKLKEIYLNKFITIDELHDLRGFENEKY